MWWSSNNYLFMVLSLNNQKNIEKREKLMKFLISFQSQKRHKKKQMLLRQAIVSSHVSTPRHKLRNWTVAGKKKYSRKYKIIIKIIKREQSRIWKKKDNGVKKNFFLFVKGKIHNTQVLYFRAICVIRIVHAVWWIHANSLISFSTNEYSCVLICSSVNIVYYSNLFHNECVQSLYIAVKNCTTIKKKDVIRIIYKKNVDKTKKNFL